MLERLRVWRQTGGCGGSVRPGCDAGDRAGAPAGAAGRWGRRAAHAVNRVPLGGGGDALMQAYHDTEWGVPHHDDRALFELLTLEGAQAGLSWRTVLVRRDAYRAAYCGFDIARVAAMTDAELEGLAGGVRG